MKPQYMPLVHLVIGQWLFEMGAPEDIRTLNDSGQAEMSIACEGPSSSCTVIV